MENTPLKIYGSIGSQSSRFVKVILETEEIPFEFKSTDEMSQEEQTQFRLMHPPGKIPLLHDLSDPESEFWLSESFAIVPYCLKKFAPASLSKYCGTDLRSQARVEEYLHWHHTALSTGASLLIHYCVMTPLLDSNSEPDKKAIGKYARLLKESLTEIDNRLKSTKFLCGEVSSMADITCCCDLEQLRLLPDHNLAPFQNIVRWRAIIREAFPMLVIVHDDLFSERVRSIRRKLESL